MHLNDEQLRAYLDHELTGAERVAEHLNACDKCRARLATIQARAQRVSGQFAMLEPRATESPRAPQMAFAQFTQKQLALRKEGFSMRNIFSSRSRPLWIGLSVIVLLAIALTLPPVQAWAEGVLAQFRVKNIVVLPVDTTGLQSLNNNSTFAQRMSQLVSDSTKVLKESGKPQDAANAAEASKLAGFAVRLPSNRGNAARFTVQGGAAFEFVVNRARAQSLLNEAGFSSMQLPASIDKATIKVNMPAGVMAFYGDCPKKDPTAPALAQPIARNCVVVSQMPSPTVDTPPNVDLTQLAEIGLQFTGMTKDQARAFSQNIDWTSTLVVPIPRNGSSYKQVQVDGVKGNLIETTYYGLQYTLIWVKNGIIYVIEGAGDPATAIAIADSMK